MIFDDLRTKDTADIRHFNFQFIFSLLQPKENRVLLTSTAIALLTKDPQASIPMHNAPQPSTTQNLCFRAGVWYRSTGLPVWHQLSASDFLVLWASLTINSFSHVRMCVFLTVQVVCCFLVSCESQRVYLSSWLDRNHCVTRLVKQKNLSL